MNYIKLTLLANTDVIINFDLVTSFIMFTNPQKQIVTCISFNSDNYLYVQETPEDILDKLGLLK